MRNGPTAYPPTMVLTADTDDRVVPGHSFKFLAALQANQTGSEPRAGPDRIEGRPRSRQADEQTNRGNR